MLLLRNTFLYGSHIQLSHEPNQFLISHMMNNMSFIINLTLKAKREILHLMFLTDKILPNKKSERYGAIFLSPYLMTFPECQESSEATSGVGCLCFQCYVLRTFAHPMIFSNFPLTDSMTHCYSKLCSKFLCPNKFSSFSSVNDFWFYSIVTEKDICCDFLLLDLVRTC